MDEKKLTEFRLFTPADFVEEQKYLESKHKSGWAFVGVKNYRYTFKLESSKKMTYIRDYKEDDIFIDDYIRMYEDCGFEFVFRTDDSYYFRKEHINYPEEKEVFSTNYDRAQYYGKLQMSLMSDTFVVVLCAIFWVLATVLAGSFSFTTFVDVIAVIFGLVFLFFSCLVFAILYIKYRKLASYKLTDAEIFEKKEEEREARGEEASIEPYGGENSNFGVFKETKYSFEELLNSQIK